MGPFISLLVIIALGFVVLVFLFSFIPIGLWISALAAGVKTLGDAKLNPDDPSVLSEMLKGLGGEAVQ